MAQLLQVRKRSHFEIVVPWFGPGASEEGRDDHVFLAQAREIPEGWIFVVKSLQVHGDKTLRLDETLFRVEVDGEYRGTVSLAASLTHRVWEVRLAKDFHVRFNQEVRLTSIGRNRPRALFENLSVNLVGAVTEPLA